MGESRLDRSTLTGKVEAVEPLKQVRKPLPLPLGRRPNRNQTPRLGHRAKNGSDPNRGNQSLRIDVESKVRAPMAEWPAEGAHGLRTLETGTDRIEKTESGFPVEDPRHLDIGDTNPKRFPRESLLELPADLEAGFTSDIIQPFKDCTRDRAFLRKVVVFGIERLRGFDFGSGPLADDIGQGGFAGMPLGQVGMFAGERRDD